MRLGTGEAAVQVLSIAPQQAQFEDDEPWSLAEFDAMVTAMCGRYGVLRQAIEELADDQLAELRRLLKAQRA
jgi:hypothetical protein